LEIAGWRINLDGFLFDEFVFQVRVPEVAGCFLAGEEDGFFQFADDQWGVWCGSLEDGAAARFFCEEDLCDIEERIDASDLMDFLADEVDGLLVRSDGDADAFCGCGFLDARG
jgi:hypothetical protein